MSASKGDAQLNKQTGHCAACSNVSRNRVRNKSTNTGNEEKRLLRRPEIKPEPPQVTVHLDPPRNRGGPRRTECVPGRQLAAEGYRVALNTRTKEGGAGLVVAVAGGEVNEEEGGVAGVGAEEEEEGGGEVEGVEGEEGVDDA